MMLSFLLICAALGVISGAFLVARGKTYGWAFIAWNGALLFLGIFWGASQ